MNDDHHGHDEPTPADRHRAAERRCDLFRTVQAVAGLVALALLAACTSAASASPTSSSSTMTMPSGGMEMDAGTLGETADASTADRTIHITATDELAFDPSAIEIAAGETVTFEIQNTGTVDHEFVLGSESFQQEHEEEMQDGEMSMDEPNEVEVPAGTTVSLTWKFTDLGTTQFGCHEPGHFPAGMVGTITVGS